MILVKLFLGAHLQPGDAYWTARSPRKVNGLRLSVADVREAIERALMASPQGRCVKIAKVEPMRGWTVHFICGPENYGKHPEYSPWYGNRWTLGVTLEPDERVPVVLYDLVVSLTQKLNCDVIAEVWVS